jgi:hypothetical protein
MSEIVLPRRQLIARAGGLVAAAGALPRVATADVHTADTEQLNSAQPERWPRAARR